VSKALIQIWIEKKLNFFIGGRLLAKDTSILILPYFMARDPTIWENPEEFKPERFAGIKDSDDSNIFGYIPFSGGYR